MKLIWAVCPFLLAFSWFVNATPEIESPAQIQARCGDDLRCYFSDEELQIAAGPLAIQVLPDQKLFTEEEGTLPPRLPRTQFPPATSAPIWASFIDNLRVCAPGCVPAVYSTYGLRATPSCHNTGDAADVGSLICAGVEHKAIDEGFYATVVQCMKGKMTVLYENGPDVTQGHHDHAHYSNGCVLPGGKKYW